MVKQKTLNPVWSQSEGAPHTLQNVLASDPREVKFMMYDRDKYQKDEFMGQCIIPVAALWKLADGANRCRLWVVILHVSVAIYSASFTRDMSVLLFIYYTSIQVFDS